MLFNWIFWKEKKSYLKGLFGDGITLQLWDNLHHNAHVNHLKINKNSLILSNSYIHNINLFKKCRLNWPNKTEFLELSQTFLSFNLLSMQWRYVFHDK